MPADKHDVIRVEGGYPISGEVPIGGAKNSVLKLMAASLMAPGSYKIVKVPDISDVKIMSDVIGTLGA